VKEERVITWAWASCDSRLRGTDAASGVHSPQRRVWALKSFTFKVAIGCKLLPSAGFS